MSNSDVRKVHEVAAEKEEHFFNYGMKDKLSEVGGPARYNDRPDDNPNTEKGKEKKRLKEEFMRVVLDIAQEAYDSAMESFNRELEQLRKTIKALERQMEENRRTWQQNGETLDKIDDVMAGFEDGGKLNRSKAAEILPDADMQDLTDAQVIALLQKRRVDMLKSNATLDDTYIVLEQDHSRFRAREDKVMEAKQRLEDIYSDPTLNAEQKTGAIHNLREEVGSKTLHTTATAANNAEAMEIADSVLHEQKLNQNLVADFKNIPGM